MKKQIDKAEIDCSELREILAKKDSRKSIIKEGTQMNELREFNLKLGQKVNFLQKRERELLEKVMLLKMAK